MAIELPKAYEPNNVEPDIYKLWIDGNYFRAEVDKAKKPFSIVIPPPNVTGQLHLGHAFDNTLQDILIRVKRMQGFSALWVPGTDHAGIATQIKVEENLRKEGKTRFDYGREAFVDIVWDWKRKYGGRIIEQLKTLGTSCDWSRERFTMDEGCSRAVREVFVRLYEKGLIYKGLRIINWCPSCTTALSDTEVEYSGRDSHLWHVRSPLADGTGSLTVATTRPETMLGDTAVAVNPDDARYKHLVGKSAILPLMGREIPIVADEYVDPAFGTGCVKITPCHDPNDFEVANRHDLEKLLIMDENAVINKNGGKYEGLDRDKARKAVIADLEKGGFLEKIEPHLHNSGSCYRCGTLVEPMASVQWFVKMAPLAEPAIEVVKDGRMTFVPERFSKTYMNWMENVRDWCVSRQLWWGHRIPAWTCDVCGELTVSREDIEACPKCAGPVKQDEDVLDTWFSSGLWPFSTLGWPDKTPELDYFYPTSVICPGYEIIFFWVARMITSGMEFMGDVPFRTALIHGMVRDEQGRKMSKSLGNGIDPVELIEAYGADALRLSLVTGVSAGNDMRLRKEKIEASRNFCNKLWNASRFVIMNIHSDSWGMPQRLELADQWILSRLMRVIDEVTENIEKFELGLAAQKAMDFVWDDFCDWYIELTKARLQGIDQEDRQTAEQILSYVLSQALKLLHPFTPFVTEAIWQALPNESGAIMIKDWPKVESRLIFEDEEAGMEKIMELIRTVRTRRSELNVPASKKAKMMIVTGDRLFSENESYIMRLARASEIEFLPEIPTGAAKMIQCVTGPATAYIPMDELVDIETERARLAKELAGAE
ncbi:MAG: valine--tRNA ligase, partial [Clostridiales bacterium]|nr:valine--tRNA ligase [Clostridiales bacterium]